MAENTRKMKTVIIKAPKPRKFDLHSKDPRENTKIIVALESLKTNHGWHFLTQVFQENINFLEKQIIKKQDENGKALSDAQIDELRMKHAYLEELVNKPEYFVKSLSRTDSGQEDLDPYERGADR